MIIHATSLTLGAEAQPEGLHNNKKLSRGADGGQLQDSGSVARCTLGEEFLATVGAGGGQDEGGRGLYM